MQDGEVKGSEGSASDAQVACELRSNSMNLSWLSRSNSSGSGRESSERAAATAKILEEHRRSVQKSAMKSVVSQQLVKLSPMEPDDQFDHVLNSLGVPMRIERCNRPALPRLHQPPAIDPRHSARQQAVVPVFVPRRFPYIPRKGHRDSDYSAATAVRLLLQFQIEISVVFLLMALLCIGTVTDNVHRNYIRASCRQAASTPTGYIALTLWQSGAVPEEMVCSIERTSPLRHARSDYWFATLSARRLTSAVCVCVHLGAAPSLR